MRRFTVGEKYAAAADKNAAYEDLKREYMNAFGVDFIGGFPPHKVIEKDGFFFLNDHGGELYTTPDNLPKHPDGDVICECGGMKFSITYGSYECIGKCLACGLSHTLYDG